MLTKRERVQATITRRGLDAIPWQFDFISAVSDKLRAYWGVQDLGRRIDDHILFALPKKPDSVSQPEDRQLTRDEFGAVWRRNARDHAVGDWGEHVEYPLKEPSLIGYTFPDPAATGRWDHVRQLRAENPDVYLMAGGFGLFENGWGLCGFENYLGYVAGEREFIEELTEGLAEFSCSVTRQLAGLGCDAVKFGDDWGFQDRLMLRPEAWRAIFKKHYARVYSAARDVGLVVAIHSCGSITDILPDLIEIGVQVVNPLQPEAMDVAFCQREYGKDLVFWGGIGCQSTLPFGTSEDVRRGVRSRLDLFRKGGYILSPAGTAPAETPVENIAAIVDEARAQLL